MSSHLLPHPRTHTTTHCCCCCTQVTISCLVNLVSDLPPESRVIPLSTIAARTKLSVDGVEFLLMKALALHLIEGSIDQVGAREEGEQSSVRWMFPWLEGRRGDAGGREGRTAVAACSSSCTKLFCVEVG